MALPATDVFTDSNGTTLEDHSANWTENYEQFQINTNALGPAASTSEMCLAHWNADVFNDDQYSEAEVVANAATGQTIGVAVRVAAAEGDGYCFNTYASGSVLGRIDDGAFTQLGSGGGALSVSEVMRIEASGTTITPKVDGVEDDPPGAQTDATYSSGYAGISGYDYVTTSRIDDWEGGNLGGGGGVIGQFGGIAWASVGQIAGVAEASISQLAGVAAN